MENINNDGCNFKSEKNLISIRSSLPPPKFSTFSENLPSHKSSKKIPTTSKKKVPMFQESPKKSYFENEEEGNFLKIDSKNIFVANNSEITKSKLKEILIDNEEKMEGSKKYLSMITENFLEKFFPGCNGDIFLINKAISNKLMKKNIITNDLIEEKINYYYSIRFGIRCNKKLSLDLENIENIGYILCYSYSKFNEYKINSINVLIEKSRKILKSETDALTDFYNYCSNENVFNPLECKKLDVWEKMEKENKYVLPGEFVFLMNTFKYINILKVDSDFIDFSTLNEDDINLFILTLLNIQFIFYKVIYFKINFMNKKLQYKIYSKYYRKLISFYKNLQNDLKVNKIYYQNNIYEKKWDFETEFLPHQYHQNKFDEKKEIINNEDNSIKESFIVIKDDEIDYNDSLLNLTTAKKRLSIFSLNKFEILEKNDIRKSISYMSFSGERMFKEKLKQASLNNNENKIKIKKILDPESERILEIIFFVILHITRFKNIENIDLIINDCYYSEFDYIFKKFCNINPVNNVDFHILDRFMQRTKKLKILNIETNILDYITFNRIISVIDKNDSLNTLQISFFTSDITYFQSIIYKMFLQIKGEIEIKVNDIKDCEKFILNELLSYFTENLEVFFELIKDKNLEVLGLNFDIPEIVEQDNRYLTVILKFILNILFLIDSPFFCLKKLSLFSPKTKLDAKFCPTIEYILNTINIDMNNGILNELDLHLQFINIKNIKNLISSNLIKLNIGDCDIETFKELTKHLSSYKFSQKSSLKVLSISILKSITEYSNEIKFLLVKIFSIKIKTLTELNICTNIFIQSVEKYKKLVKMLDCNWISTCRLIINKKCLSYNDNYSEKLFYLVSRKLEESLLEPDELTKREKFKLNDTDKSDEVYWYLRYLFNNVYKIGNNFEKKKTVIFSILKYLYLMKEVTFFYKYE